MAYILEERGIHKTRKGEFPFIHYFKEPGPFYNVMSTRPDEARKFPTKAAAARMIKERGLRGFKIVPAPATPDRPQGRVHDHRGLSLIP